MLENETLRRQATTPLIVGDSCIIRIHKNHIFFHFVLLLHDKQIEELRGFFPYSNSLDCDLREGLNGSVNHVAAVYDEEVLELNESLENKDSDTTLYLGYD